MAKLAELWDQVSRTRLGALLAPVRVNGSLAWTMRLGSIQTGPGPAELVIEQALALAAGRKKNSEQISLFDQQEGPVPHDEMVECNGRSTTAENKDLGDKQLVTRTVVLKRELAETDKVNPQGKVIAQLLSKGPMERSKLVAAVEKKMEGKTVQSAATIVAFQLTAMKKLGLVEVQVDRSEAPKVKGKKTAEAKPAAKPAAKAKGKKTEAPAAEAA